MASGRLLRRVRWPWRLFAGLAALLFVLTIVPLIIVLLSSLRPASALSYGWTLDHYRACKPYHRLYRLRDRPLQPRHRAPDRSPA